MNDTKTVSGAIVHITDADEAPLVKCLVDITPKQSGTGTPSPSNVRPISGWESVSVFDTGKNLLKNSVTSKTISGLTCTRNEDGTVHITGTATNSIALNVAVESDLNIPSGTYIVSGCPSGGSSSTYRLYIGGTDENGSGFGTLDIGSGKTVTVSSFVTIQIQVFPAAGAVDILFAPMIRRADDTDPTYEPYTGTTTPVNLGRTVYGADVEIVGGELTVDRAYHVLSNTHVGNPMDYKAGYAKAYIGNELSPPAPSGTITDIVCNMLVGKNVYSLADSGIYIYGTGTNLGISVPFSAIDGYSDIGDNSNYSQAITKFLTDNQVQIIYPLATPQTYTLTGQEVSAMYGENYIWASSGPVEITYHTNVLGIYNKIYIDGRPYFRPNDFQLAREDVYAGEYTSCTGKLIADKIGWKYSDLPMKWDILPDEDLVYLTTLTGAFDLIFRDSDGQHTEQVIRRGFTNTPTRLTGPNGAKLWTGLEMEISFLNTHPIDEE